jgi:hypothetical protein
MENGFEKFFGNEKFFCVWVSLWVVKILGGEKMDKTKSLGIGQVSKRCAGVCLCKQQTKQCLHKRQTRQTDLLSWKQASKDLE